MDWIAARERLGAELVGAREQVVQRFKVLLAEQGELPKSLEGVTSELVLNAGAALADGASPEFPWTRCGGVLRIDAHRGDRPICLELCTLWRAMEWQISRVSFSELEEREATEHLGQQLDAALRGAVAETRDLLLEEPIDAPALRFGGVKVLTFSTARDEPSAQVA
jgi:hypothetical protein